MGAKFVANRNEEYGGKCLNLKLLMAGEQVSGMAEIALLRIMSPLL